MTTRDKGITLPAFPSPATQLGGIKSQGVGTFTASLTLVVPLPAAEADTNYNVLLGPLANKTFWVSGKTTTQFTINASALSSDPILWAVLAR